MKNLTKKPFNTLSKAALAAALVTTAIIPVASVSAATSNTVDEVVIVQDGLQLSVSAGVYREAVIEGLTTATDVGYIHSTNGKYYSSQNYREAVIEKGSESAALEYLNNSKLDAAITPVAGKFEGGKLVPAEVKGFASVASINATTIEVTFDQKVGSLPEASAFSIPGISVNKTAFKEDTGQKVVILTTSTQSSQAYTLSYNGNSKTFIGKTNLGSVLLSAEKYEVEIVPSENKLTPVEITAELENFPEGAEAVIEFTTSFGKVVDVTTTQNGKAVFQLTPLETLKDQTASVTGKVVEVKNPTTGQTYPDFKNSSVGTVNVKFVINEKNDNDVIKSYKVETAYAEQADRAYVKMAGGIDGKIQSALQYQPEKLIKATNSDTEKELYRHLKDVMFSNIQKVVNDNKGTGTPADIKNIKDKLKDAFVVNNKDLTASDLRNILRQDAFNDRYNTVYAPLGGNKVQLDKEINNISSASLEGLIEYYKLVSKFVVLDNVKDSAAPHNPDNVFPVEYVYAEDNALVLVLASQRSDESMDYTTDKFVQTKNENAQFLQDNASHQVIFVNDAQKDRYEITGDPTFKLEDSESLKLISVKGERYKVQTEGQASDGAEVGKFCKIPYAVEVEEDSNYDPGTDGGVTPGTGPSYNGTPKLSAKNREISSDFMRFDLAKGTVNADKLGEIKVVFSEAVSVQDVGTAFNPANWTIDGINLQSVVDKGFDINFRLASTDSTKQLRDSIIVTFSSKADTTDAMKRDTEFINKFIEGAQHKVEISKVGDWAAQTDSKNLVPTQSLDYKGKALNEATPWGPKFISGTSKPGEEVSKAIAPGEAFVVRADGLATKASAPGVTKDVVRVLFSEPMKITGTDSILEKANYRLDGKELPSVGTSIRLGIDGVSEFTDSTCAVTIELPKGYLQENDNNHVVSISNVKGTDDNAKLNERIQLAYARQYTIVGENIIINGDKKTTGLYNDYVNTITYGKATAVGKVYKDADGNVIDFTNSPVIGTADFFTKHLAPATNVPMPPATIAQRAALQSAVTLADAAATVADPVDYEPGALATYQTAIANATAVLNDPTSTVAQVNTAKTALDAATQVFNNAKKAEDVTTFADLGPSAKIVNDGLGTKQISFLQSQLADELKGSSYTITVGEETHNFSVSPLNPDRYLADLLASTEDTEINKGVFKTTK